MEKLGSIENFSFRSEFDCSFKSNQNITGCEVLIINACFDISQLNCILTIKVDPVRCLAAPRHLMIPLSIYTGDYIAPLYSISMVLAACKKLCTYRILPLS